MSRQDNEVDMGNYRTTGTAIALLGTFGILVGAVMAFGNVGDPRIVEARGMVTTGCILGCVGVVMWWWGREP